MQLWRKYGRPVRWIWRLPMNLLALLFSWMLDGPQWLQDWLRDFRRPDPEIEGTIGPIADFMIGFVIGHAFEEVKDNNR